MAQTVRTTTIVITAKVYIADEYAGYSADDLETELSMALDEVELKDIGNGATIGSLSVWDVSCSEPVDEEVAE